MQQPSSRSSKLRALQSWCWAGGGEPEREKEEEVEAPVYRNRAMPKPPQAGKSRYQH